MSPIKYLGVDLCKLELVADLAAEAKPRAFPNEAGGHAAFLAALPAGAHVVCESTGGYQRALVAALHAAQVPVSVVSPARVRHFARAQGLRAKTDPIDARLLTAFGQAMACAALPPPSAEALELQALVRARQVLPRDSTRKPATTSSAPSRFSKSRPRRENPSSGSRSARSSGACGR